MGFDAWEGQLVRLRAMRPDDAEVLLEHSRDGEAQLAAGGGIQFPISVESVRRWIEETAKAPPDADDAQLLIETIAGDLVGGINPHHCNSRFGTFAYGVTVFREHWRNGYASEAIQLVLGHFFDERRYQKCTVSVYSFNEASLLLHRDLGFKEEGRLRRMIYAHGTHHDEVFLGITADEFVEST